MRHHALCLLPTPITSNASNLAFSFELQAAAGRAWARSFTSTATTPRSNLRKRAKVCIMAHDNHLASKWDSLIPRHRLFSVTNGKKIGRSSICSSTAQRNIESPLMSRRLLNMQPREPPAVITQSAPPHGTPRVKLRRQRPVTYFDPENIRDTDMQWVDPGRSDIYCNTLNSPYANDEDSCYRDDSVLDTLNSVNPIEARPNPTLLPAKTTVSLYQNLLYAISYSTPLPGLPALLDYHDLHPNLRSTRSYNLLIWFALRHRSFGTVQWLFTSMRADGLSGNLETWKLKIRWLLQAGRWNWAWDEVMDSPARANSMDRPADKWSSPVRPVIPLPIWLEFLRAPDKRGRYVQGSSIDDEVALQQAAKILMGSSNPSELGLTQDCTLIQGSSQASPHAMYLVVMALLRSRQNAAAFALTEIYFKALPSVISAAWVRTCLNIVHLHIVLGSSSKGTRKLYESRRAMRTLMALHPALHPTSTTLFLLLSPLRQSKRCGTIAWKVFSGFKAQWGARIEDRRVRRRLIALALKEGRMDIVSTVMDSEKISRRAHSMWKRTRLALGGVAVSPSRRLLRPRAKKIFKYNGREERLWQRLAMRMKRLLQKKQTK